MESFEVNKLLGALLGTLFVVMTLGIVSDGIFSSPAPEKPGFEIVATEQPAAGGQAAGGGQQAADQPIAPLLAKADAKAGETIFKKCQACHDGTKGGPNKIGPNLWGVVDRPIASHEGFSYSSGMKEFSQNSSVKWDYEHLSKFLTSPKADVKGTAMTFAGLKKPEDRANVIAYLRTLADSPPPLPQ
jgi:cytochrome c